MDGLEDNEALVPAQGKFERDMGLVLLAAPLDSCTVAIMFNADEREVPVLCQRQDAVRQRTPASIARFHS